MFQFPSSPAVNQTFTPVSGTTYRWSGTAWHLLAGPGAFITQAEGDARYLQQAGADALYVNVNEVANIQNRIINGKFAIDQRNAGAAVAVGPGAVVRGADLWIGQNVFTTGAFQIQRQISVGISQLGVTVTATGTPAAGHVALVQQRIEGINVADLGFGAAGASSITVAFDILSSIAGTYSVSVSNSAANRSYVAPYTVSAASVFETKVLTIPGDTTGTWATDNTAGLNVLFSLGAGTNFNAPAGNAWNAGNFTNVAGNVNLLGTASAFIVLRNVRLYKGSVDFGPDRRFYAEELALCQRYYEKTFPTDTAPVAGLGTAVGTVQGHGATTGATEPLALWTFAVEKRATPTITLYNPRPGGAAGQWTDGAATDSANARAIRLSTRFAVIDNGAIAFGTGGIFIAATASAEL